MRYRQLGSSGLRVSVLGIGCNNFGTRSTLEEARAVVDAALEEGVTLFDTAPVYGSGSSEEMLGQALRGRRDSAVIATKCAYRAEPDAPVAPGSRVAIRREVEGSLRRLGTDHIDLYQLHFPDPFTPLEETIGAMGELVGEGKVRYIGSCNLPAWQVVAADAVARAERLERWVSAQDRYNLLERDAERELLPATRARGIGFLPYYPLANGLLTGKYRRGEEPPAGARLAAENRRHLVTDDRLRAVEAIVGFATDKGLSVLDVAIGGLAAQAPVTSVIAGARTPAQVRDNAAAAAWEPSTTELSELRALLDGLEP